MNNILLSIIMYLLNAFYVFLPSAPLRMCALWILILGSIYITHMNKESLAKLSQAFHGSNKNRLIFICIMLVTIELSIPIVPKAIFRLGLWLIDKTISLRLYDALDV